MPAGRVAVVTATGSGGSHGDLEGLGVGGAGGVGDRDGEAVAALEGGDAADLTGGLSLEVGPVIPTGIRPDSNDHCTGPAEVSQPLVVKK